MASSGQITVYTESVDWPNYSRGACQLTNVIGWSVNDSGNISFWSISSSDNVGGSWGVCTTGNGHLIMTVQVNYGGGWSDLLSASVARATCPNLTNAISASTTLIGMLGSGHLTGNCSMRILYYADLNPHPSSDLPNAFPSESYSAEVQVPVNVDVNWTSTLSYNANGGSGAPGNQTHSNSASSSSYNQTISSTIPTRTNYRFDGWADSSSASTPAYQPGGSVTIYKSSPSKTIYAVWTEFYRPGERKVSDTWRTHNRSGGACERKVSGTWTEMRTIDGGTGTGDPPSRKTSGTWYNQRKIGAE